MKAILEFDPIEEEFDFRVASRYLDWWSIVWDMDQYLRGEIKYADLTDEQRQYCEKVRDHLSELMDERGLRFD